MPRLKASPTVVQNPRAFRRLNDIMRFSRFADNLPRQLISPRRGDLSDFSRARQGRARTRGK
jgi:hypothetical protein